MPATHLPQPPYRQTTLIGLLVLVLVGLFTWQSWRTDRDDQLQQLRTAAELADRATDRYFSQQQLALGELAGKLLAEGGLGDPRRGHRLLLDFKNRHSQLLSMHLLGLDGRYLASSVTSDVRTVPLVTPKRNFASIVAGLRAEQPLELAHPLLGPLSQRWTLPLRYAVRSAGGEPLAQLVGAAPVGLVQSFWNDAPVVRHAAVALLRDDGYLIDRYLLPAGTSDDEVYGAPRTGSVVGYLRSNNHPRRGTVAGSSSLVPGDPHVSVFVRLEHFPVTLLVTMSQRRMVLNWWERAAAPLLLIVALAALGLVFFHQPGRRERDFALERLQAEQRLCDSEAFLLRTGQAARIGGWTIDVGTRAVRGAAGLFRIMDISSLTNCGRSAPAASSAWA